MTENKTEDGFSQTFTETPSTEGKWYESGAWSVVQEVIG